MKISASGEYAVRLVVAVAKKQGQVVSLKEVANEENISIKFAEKIASALVKAQILTSMRGQDGGHKLSKPTSKTSVGEILKATGDLSAVAECLTAGCPMIDKCSSITVWQRLNGLINEYLDSVMISTLIENNLKMKK